MVTDIYSRAGSPEDAEAVPGNAKNFFDLPDPLADALAAFEPHGKDTGVHAPPPVRASLGDVDVLLK